MSCYSRKIIGKGQPDLQRGRLLQKPRVVTENACFQFLLHIPKLGKGGGEIHRVPRSVQNELQKEILPGAESLKHSKGPSHQDLHK